MNFVVNEKGEVMKNTVGCVDNYRDLNTDSFLDKLLCRFRSISFRESKTNVDKKDFAFEKKVANDIVKSLKETAEQKAGKRQIKTWDEFQKEF